MRKILDFSGSGWTGTAYGFFGSTGPVWVGRIPSWQSWVDPRRGDCMSSMANWSVHVRFGKSVTAPFSSTTRPVDDSRWKGVRENEFGSKISVQSGGDGLKVSARFPMFDSVIL